MAHLRRFLTMTLGDVMISCEDLTDFPEEDLSAMADFFSALFSQVSIVLYVRDPMGGLSSSVQELVKSGFTLEQVERHLHGEEDLQSAMLAPIRDRIEKVQRAFATADLQMRPFDPSGFVDGNLLKDFCNTAQISEISFEDAPQNTRASDQFITQMSALNAKNPLLKNGLMNPDRDPWLADVAAHFTDQPFQVPDNWQRIWEDTRREDKRWFHAQFPDVNTSRTAKVTVLKTDNAPDLETLHQNLRHKRAGEADQTLHDAIKSGDVERADMTALRFCTNADLLQQVAELFLRHHRYYEARSAYRMAILRHVSNPKLWKNYLWLCNVLQSDDEVNLIAALQPERRQVRLKKWRDKLLENAPQLSPVKTEGALQVTGDGHVSGWLTDPAQNNLSLPFVVTDGQYQTGPYLANQHIGARKRNRNMIYCGFSFWKDPRMTGEIVLKSVASDQVFMAVPD
ncbi:hypothetical protein [Halocynthiibacter styelae]|uniref:Uncharacterized protein n=1 Tax=Halocynthiibacter styelae TaxID=2761955 RepID=A0A8J7IZL2_9RHOB|nr:hypothetical protein [Paenihalocynthiibacter styelae]MBI1495079.1 hypothetical protein [Paenihalocynthiibacter styelae]